MTASSSIHPLNALFVALVSLQALFVLELLSDVVLPELFIDHRSGWLLAEFLGTAVLFVDMIVRFDELNPARKPFYLAGIAGCAMGWCFQFFVHYLDSALMS
ncbi:MAG: hypothetical protein CL828_09370 [Crocinitomicaceae bacterium]|nr:hypothetical protein [Crocinitomicaceae bacterium]